MSEIFQEKHQTGFLWRRRVYYKYFRYFEGSMIQVSIYPEETIKSLEAK